jgi:nucleoside-diphosphate-sugar epimerase
MHQSETLHTYPIHYVSGDLRDFSTITPHLENCHMVVHGASVTHARYKKDYMEINWKATRHLVDEASVQGVKHFVYVSTNSAGPNNGGYGRTKWMAERYVKAKMSSWLILRLSEVFGVSSSDGIDGLIQKSLHRSLLLCPQQVPFPFSPIHVEKATQQLYDAVFKSGNWNQMQLISGEEHFSYDELIKLIGNISRKKIRMINVPKKLMILLKWLLVLYPSQLSIVPDQIDRLYGQKQINEANGINTTIREYIREQNM